jgi:hypothetical protein
MKAEAAQDHLVSVEKYVTNELLIMKSIQKGRKAM